MDYEKKYKDALKIAKSKIKNDKDHILYEDDIIEIFSELKDEDEKIKNAIIESLPKHKFYLPQTNIKVEDAIAWLEKQSKPLENYDEAEKEKFDFVGDGFIKCYANFQDFKEGKTYWLEYMGDDKYNVRSDNLLGKTYHITPCQLYTVFKKLTWLEKQGEQKSVDVEKAMAEIDAKAKIFTEAHKGESSDEILRQMRGEQNPAWSEVDKDFMYDTLSNLTELKDRYGEGYGNVGKCIDWLKSFKERLLPSSKREWSEEDERHFELIILICKEELKMYHTNSLPYTNIDEAIDWLKSLKDKCTWKPSDAQIKAVRLARSFVTDDFSDNPTLSEILTELEEQLKKLKG